MSRTTIALAAATAAIGLAAVFACARGDTRPAQSEPPPAEPETIRLLDGLGNHHHPITTQSPLAQRYFDQGLALAFGFNHDAAIRSFEAGLAADPTCAMCAWGVAIALGPNINAPMGPEAARLAYPAAQRALALSENASEREKEYIQALATRYAAAPTEDRSALDRAYADAMRSVYQEDPSDIDGAVLFAEALMDLSPWNYWTPAHQPRENTEEMLDVLELAIEADPEHVGANHFYIHAVEMPYPERGVPAAERLAALAPAAGHLVHMPSHIFWRVGRYDDALEINRRAAASDERFFATCRPGAFYRASYYAHNIHFLWAAAAAEGRSALALTAARQLEASTAASVASFPFLEEQMTVPELTLARFGRWDALLGTPKPPAEQVYRTGIWHYTRGLALVRTGRIADARAELDAVAAAAQSKPAAELMLAGGVASAGQLLDVGHAHLAGEIAAARGDVPGAVKSLRDAVARQDAIPYIEPPPWYFPTRQALGAVLLDAGRAADAEAVYRTDLQQYPNNGWSLLGLAASLRAQGDTAAADWAQKGFENAWARADVELASSRF